MIYLGVDGVVREADYPMAGVHGIARELEDGYVGVDGVARQILWGHIPPELIERIELQLHTLDVYTLDENGNTGEAVISRKLSDDTDLDVVAEYGEVNIDVGNRMLEVNCSKAGYDLSLDGELAIVLRSGRHVPWSRFSRLQEAFVNADYYLRFNWSGSSHLEGLYSLICCGESLLSGYISGGASGSKTITLMYTQIRVDAGIISGRGTATTRTTVNTVSIGGTTFLPEIVYGG